MLQFDCKRGGSKVDVAQSVGASIAGIAQLVADERASKKAVLLALKAVQAVIIQARWDSSSPAPGPGSNFAAKRIGMNIAGANSYEYGHTYLDWTRRFAQPFLDGTAVGGSTPAALKANGTPVASYHYSLQAGALAADIGVYDCQMPGTCDAPGVGAGLQMYYGGTQQVGAFTNFAYNAGTDRTTCTLTTTGGTGPMIVVSNPSTTAGYLRIVPHGYDPVANGDDFHPDLVARMATHGVTSIRGMDWFDVNNAAVTDTSWAGSVAAGADGSIRSASRSLAEFIRLANALSADVHVCCPRAANSDWFNNFFATVGANLPTNRLVDCEHSDEPWNAALANNSYYMAQLLALAGTFVGASNMAPQILSAVRAGGVVTLTLNGAPATTTSCIVIGITNITGGFIDASKGISVTGDVITYNETGADVTGVITTAANNFFSYVHTNPTHYLVKALTTYGSPSTTGVSPLVMLYRYVVELTRAWWTIAQTMPDKARYRFIINSQPGANEFAIYSYAQERFGDHTWIHSVQPAPYFFTSPIGKTSAQIIAGLNTALTSLPFTLIKEANAARSFRHPVSFYEYGPATNGGTSADMAAVGAAHHDPGMGAAVTAFLSMARDLVPLEKMHYFKDGCSFNYASHIEADNEQGWNIVDQSNTDLTGPKPQALIAFAAGSSAPQSYNGLTWGTINFTDVCAVSTSNGTGGGSLLFNNTAALPYIVVTLVAPAPGTYLVEVYWASAAGAADWCTVLFDDVEVAHQAPLTAGYPTPTTPFFSQLLTFGAGFRELRFQTKPANRAQFMALLKVVAG